MGMISWVIFGAIVGWIAAKLAGTEDQQGFVMTTVLGIAGALLGGFIYGFFQDEEVVIDWNIGSLVLAVIGAVVVSWGWALLTKRKV